MKQYEVKAEYKENSFAALIKVTSGILFVVGIFVGFKMLHTALTFAILYWGLSFISSLLIFGLGEIIQILSDLKTATIIEKEE